MEKIIIADEVRQRKECNLAGLPPTERQAFVKDWKTCNSNMLLEQLGSKDDDVSFLTGVLFAPSFVSTTVPHLQNTFVADACHLNFGKYTLFSCYGITANANTSPVAFAILFDNENTTNWTKY